MAGLYRGFIILLAVWLGGCGCVSRPAKHGAPVTQRSDDLAVAHYEAIGDSARLTLDVNRFTALGKPALATFVVTNLGNEEIVLNHRSDAGDISLTLLNYQHENVPRTEFGKKAVRNDRYFSNRRITLPPGASIKRVMDLRKYFQLSVSGIYALSASRPIEHPDDDKRWGDFGGFELNLGPVFLRIDN